MALTSKLGRPLLAAMFISGGIDQLRDPGPKVSMAEDVIDGITDQVQNQAPDTVDVPEDPETWVRLNGAVQVTAGSLLALGKLPRLSALALAGSLVPTTLAGHRFWEADDEAERTQQQTHFFKNVAMLGGLLLAVGDRDGKPSMGWRARRAVARNKPAAERAVDAATAGGSSLAASARTVADKAAPTVKETTRTVADKARDVAAVAAPMAAYAGKVVADSARDAADRAAPIARDLTDSARQAAEVAAERAREIRAA